MELIVYSFIVLFLYALGKGVNQIEYYYFKKQINHHKKS